MIVVDGLVEARRLPAGHAREIARVDDLSIRVTHLHGAFEPHAHDGDEAFWILSGEGHLDLGKDARPIGAGELVKVPRGTAHRTRTTTPTHALLLARVDAARVPPTAAPAAPPPTVRVHDAASARDTAWSPRVVAAVDDHRVKVVRLDGTFPWHAHESDELFYVLDGRLIIGVEGAPDVELGDGQLVVVPAGVRHAPRTRGPVLAVLIERAGVVNTGDADVGDFTAETDRWA